MTKQVEKSGVDKIMELFMQMRQDDKEREDRRLKDIQEREERREIERLEREVRRKKEDRDRDREEREREERREERQARLIQQLKEAQPAIPQTIQINQHKLPVMTDKDDVENFIGQLEIALRTGNVPRDNWKQHLLSQLTVSVK